MADHAADQEPERGTALAPNEARRKRLRYQSWHRGTRETDLMIGGFADRHLAGLDAAQLDAFEALLALPDVELFDLVTGRVAAAPPHDAGLLALIRRAIEPGTAG